MENKHKKSVEEYELILNEKDRIIADRDQIIAEKDATIEELRADVRRLLEEKEDMIDNFRISTNVLIEKMKDIESQKTGTRPPTAGMLLRPKNGAAVEGSRKGLGRATKINSELQAELEKEIPEDTAGEKAAEEERKNASERKKCLNCQKLVDEEDFEAHTIICFRNATKCKICGEYIAPNAKISHLNEWRDPQRILGFIESKNYEKLKLCFKHGAEVNHQIPGEGNASYLHMAVKKGIEELFSVLMGFGINIELVDDEGNTPLILASQNDNIEISKSLIEVGANVDAKNKIGWSSLFYACKRGDKQLVDFLLENKAKPAEATVLGDTPLKIAQKYGHNEIAIKLVSGGASLRSSKGFKIMSKQVSS